MKMKIMPVPAMATSAMTPAKKLKRILKTRKLINPKREVPAA